MQIGRFSDRFSRKRLIPYFYAIYFIFTCILVNM